MNPNLELVLHVVLARFRLGYHITRYNLWNFRGYHCVPTLPILPGVRSPDIVAVAHAIKVC